MSDENCGSCFSCVGSIPVREGSFITVGLTRMIVCATCGNKRCPHGTDHRLACTESNEPGQKGSRYQTPEQAKAEWGAFVAESHKKGLCEFSGMRVTQCQRTICDCFESPEGAAEIERKAAAMGSESRDSGTEGIRE